jgi:hypothetical protein
MPLVNAPQPGVNGVIYRNMNPTPVSAVNALSPVWSRVVANVSDVEIGKSKTKVDVTKRLGGGVKQYEPGNLDISFTLTMLHGPGNDEDIVAFTTAFWAGSHVELLLIDQALILGGAQGTAGPFKIFNDNEKQPIDGMQEHAYDFAPCFHPLVRAGFVSF